MTALHGEIQPYLDALGKPVEARIADYHVGGTGDHATVMPAGMPAFTKDAVYDGMMRNFAQTFGDAENRGSTLGLR